MGCADIAESDCSEIGPKCWSARYFSYDESGSLCGVVDKIQMRRIPVALFLDKQRTDSELRSVTRSLASYYGGIGLAFEAVSGPRSVELGTLISASSEAVTDLENDDETAEERTVALRRLFLLNLREFLIDEAEPDAWNLVVLPAIVDPLGTQLFGLSGELNGFAISEHLLAASNKTGASTMDLALPNTVPSAMFLSAEIVKDSVYREAVTAHEFGHTCGLLHVSDSGNLMNGEIPDDIGCAPVLSSVQISAIDAATARD